MSEETLTDLLNDDVEIPEVEAVEETEAAEEETESTDENEGLPSEPEGQEAEQTETEETPEEESKGEDFSEREKAFLAKANDEKAKRQELERKLADQDKPEETALPDPIDDPEGYAKALEQRNANSQFAMRVTLSQELMREKHADYDEKEAAFAELMKENPALVQGLHNSSNPAKYAYDLAVKHERMAQFDNFDTAVKSEVEKQVSAATEKLREELEKEYSAKLKTATSLPPSGAKGSLGSDDTISGDESLADILGN